MNITINQIRPYVLQWIASWHGATSNHPGWLPFGQYNSLADAISSTKVPFFASLPGRALSVVSWTQTVIVVTTNSSSAYWNLKLYRKTTADADILIGKMDTRNMAADDFVSLSISPGAALLATDVALWIEVSKVGTPGAISLGSPLVYVR